MAVVEAIVAVVLCAVLARAFLGRAPERPDSLAAAGWLVAGLLLLVLVLAGPGGDTWTVPLNAASVIAFSVAGWWVRGGRDDGCGGEPPADPPIDWDAFDRERDGWRPRQPA
jgi:hypothetical protein